MRTSAGFQIIALLVGLFPSLLLADGLILNGISPRSVGRGGTNIGFADNGAVWFDNPAAAVNVQRRTLFEAGLDVLITDFEYSDPANQNASSLSATPIPQVGFVRKSESGDFAYGLGFYFPAGFEEDFKLNGPFPLLGRRTYASSGTLAKLLPGFAYRVNDRLSIGGTVGLGFSQVELEGPLFIQSGFLRGTPTLLDLDSDGVTAVWSLGLQYQLSDRTTFGLTYQSESRFDLDGKATVQVPLLGASNYDAKVNITWPRSLGGGLRHQLDERNTIGVDVIWYDWSSALDDLGVDFRNPSNPFFFPLKDQLPLRWRDTVSIRTGYERKVACNQTLRLGYVYHRNPVPDSTLTPYLQAILQHTFSVGYGWQGDKYDIDVGYRFLFGDTEDVGTSQIVGGDFDQSSHRAYVHSLVLGIQWGARR